jgi:hypothetical protein
MLSKHDVWANFKQCFVSPVEIQRLGQLANSVKIGGIFMKRVLILLMVAATGSAAAEATHRQCRVVTDPSCCQPRTDHCSTSGGGSNRWYKAKDGTFREMMNYRDALSRAEDADDMEIQLRGIQAELVSAKAGIETMQSDTAKLKADLESQIASLQQQLEAERQTVVAQKERGDKAEAAHKQCIEQIASLRDAGRKSDETLKATQSELSRTTEERDNLKAARADLVRFDQLLCSQFLQGSLVVNRHELCGTGSKTSSSDHDVLRNTGTCIAMMVFDQSFQFLNVGFFGHLFESHHVPDCSSQGTCRPDRRRKRFHRTCPPQSYVLLGPARRPDRRSCIPDRDRRSLR